MPSNYAVSPIPKRFGIFVDFPSRKHKIPFVETNRGRSVSASRFAITGVDTLVLKTAKILEAAEEEE